MSTRSANQDWHFEPESWAERERLVYRARAAFMQLELAWELEKPKQSAEVRIRATGSMRMPLKKERRITWYTDAAAFPENQGFKLLEELDPQQGRKRKWDARPDFIGFSEVSGGAQTENLSLPTFPGVRVFNAFQVPALLRTALASGAEDTLVLVVSRRFYALRVQESAQASKGTQRFRVEVANIVGDDLLSADWASARLAEIDWDSKAGVAVEIRVRAPVVGELRVTLEMHEASKA